MYNELLLYSDKHLTSYCCLLSSIFAWYYEKNNQNISITLPSLTSFVSYYIRFVFDVFVFFAQQFSFVLVLSMTSLSENDQKNEINIETKQCTLENEQSSLLNHHSKSIITVIQG
jgi:hypothetical protein